ncbi:MAG: peroxidase [Rhodospirillaceae bacterium]|nr:peroxidase [Rhodospirillaceae bacterium]
MFDAIPGIDFQHTTRDTRLSKSKGLEMPFFPSLPDDAGIGQLFSIKPGHKEGFSKFSEAVMRDDSVFSIGERELIAAFTSALNSCDYCYGGHSAIAQQHGIEKAIFESVIDDIDLAPVADKLKPILRFVRKLTVEPHKMVQADADAVFDAGWDEEALADAIWICARFNMMNRLSLGHGLNADPAMFEARAKGMNYGKR